MRPLLLVDAHALALRGHHSLPPMATGDGLPTSALYGLAATLIRLLGDQRPRGAAAVLDGGLASDGEAPRRAPLRPTPPVVLRQLALARVLVEVLGFRSFLVPGWSAKDVLATLAQRLGSPDRPVLLVGGDRDLAQLVRPGVSLLLLSRAQGDGRLVTPTEATLATGLPPRLQADRDALVGRAIDGVPGVPGVGPRTAARLLLRHGSLDGVLRHLDEVQPERLRRALAAAAPSLDTQRARLALRADVPLVVDERALAMDWDRLSRALPLFERLEFRSLLPRLASVMERGAASARSY